MTNSPVKGTNPLMDFGSVMTKGRTPKDLAGNFTDAFSKASGQQNMQMQSEKLPGSTQVKVEHTDRKNLNNANETGKDANAVKTEKVQPDKNVQDEVQKAGEELVGKVAEELGVSEEDVRSAMEILGLTMADLLNPDNMTQLVLTLEGADMLSLMTDEGLYNSLQNLLGMVNETVNNLQKELGISPEELAALLEQAQNTEEAVAEEQPKDTPVDDAAQNADGQDDYTVTVEKDGEVVKVSVEVDGNAKTETAEVTSEKVQMPEELAKENSGKEEGTKKDNSSQSNNTQGNMLLENLLNRDNNVVKADTAFANTMAGNAADTQNIMNQIMDYMKIQVKTDMTQMEIQLHPASLGTININISSKEGVITAQFLTQNEAVKAAIESQIVQLKNSFEEQGIKIEAVEVTVESHAFERNLSGESDSRQQSQNGKKKGGRKINLNELNPEEEAQMGEEEQLAAAMMSAGGNTVDFTA